MKITTNNGKMFEVQFAEASIIEPNRMIIELVDERPFAEIAADFDGLETITKSDDDMLEEVKVYEGFSRLYSIQRAVGAKTTLLMLDRIK